MTDIMPSFQTRLEVFVQRVDRTLDEWEDEASRASACAVRCEREGFPDCAECRKARRESERAHAVCEGLAHDIRVARLAQRAEIEYRHRVNGLKKRFIDARDNGVSDDPETLSRIITRADRMHRVVIRLQDRLTARGA